MPSSSTAVMRMARSRRYAFAAAVVAGLVKTHTRWQGAGILGILRRRLQEQRITDLASTDLSGHERNHGFRGGNGDIELRSAHAVAGSTGGRPADLEADPPFGLKINIFIYCGIRYRDQTRMPSSARHFNPQPNAKAAGARRGVGNVHQSGRMTGFGQHGPGECSSP